MKWEASRLISSRPERLPINFVRSPFDTALKFNSFWLMPLLTRSGCVCIIMMYLLGKGSKGPFLIFL